MPLKMIELDESPDPLGLNSSEPIEWQRAAPLTASDEDQHSTPHSTSPTTTLDDDEELSALDATKGEAFYSPAPFEETRSRNIAVDIPHAVLVTPRSRHEGF